MKTTKNYFRFIFMMMLIFSTHSTFAGLGHAFRQIGGGVRGVIQSAEEMKRAQAHGSQARSEILGGIGEIVTTTGNGLSKAASTSIKGVSKAIDASSTAALSAAETLELKRRAAELSETAKEAEVAKAAGMYRDDFVNTMTSGLDAAQEGAQYMMRCFSKTKIRQ